MDSGTTRELLLRNGMSIFDLFQTGDQFGRIEYLAEGEENYIYKILGHKGKYVARVLKPGNVRTRQDYIFEFTFQDYLRKHGLPIPRVYPCLDGEPFAMFDTGDKQIQATLHEFVKGGIVSTPVPAQVQAAGAVLGRFHRAATTLALSYDRLTHIDALAWLDDTDAADTTDDTMTQEAVALYQKHTQIIKSSLPKLRKIPLHNDIHFGNLLFNGDHLTAVLDFDESHKHYIPLELGWSAGQICNIGDLGSFKKNLKTFWQGYSDEYKLSGLEKSVALSALIAETSRKFLKHPMDSVGRRKFSNVLGLAKLAFRSLRPTPRPG